MDNIKLNSKIEIINKDQKKMKGMIHDIVEDMIIVAVSPGDENFKLLEIGEDVNCISYDKENTVGFYGEIADRVYQHIPKCFITNITEFQNVQRRQDIRVPISTDISYTSNRFLLKIYEKEKKQSIIKKSDRYFNEGIMSDISAGGAKFSCDINFSVSSKLLLLFKLGENDFLTRARILHKDIKIVSSKSLYVYGVAFEDILEIEREEIVRYIFIMMRKRGSNR